MTGTLAAESLLVPPDGWLWMPRLPVIDWSSSPRRVGEGQQTLRQAGYEPVEGLGLDVVCQTLGEGTLLLATAAHARHLWATRETLAFARQFPVLLGGLGMVPPPTPFPPRGYGVMARWCGDAGTSVIPYAWLDGEGRTAVAVMQATGDHLALAYQQRHPVEVRDAVELLFLAHQAAVMCAYAAAYRCHMQGGRNVARRRRDHAGRLLIRRI